MNNPANTSGFSLVELSIVLVILGLLVGGSLVGKSLIRAAQLRAITTEQTRWTTATHAFRDKYMKFPGDFPDATRVWGRMNSNADCVTNSSASVNSTGNCDGNGDGSIGSAAAASQVGEMHQFWRHLASAGMIEGIYTGIAGAGGGTNSVLTPDANVPASKISQAGWAIRTHGTITSSTYYFNGYYGNTFYFGKSHGSGSMETEAITPEEAFNIDIKMDDEKPATGKLTVRVQNDKCAMKTDGVTLATSTDLDAIYNVPLQTITCMLYFRQSF